MVNKQSWRDSKQILFFFLLLFTHPFLFSAEMGGIHGKQEESSDNSSSEFEGNNNGRRWSEREFFPVYSEKEIAIQERILRTQGTEVNKLHEDLTKPDRVNRVALFHGEPGTGKTEGVHGVCRRTGFKLERIDRHQFTSGYYGESGKKLVEILNQIVSNMQHRVIFIDECDKIFDHPKQPNRDTAQTANDFWVWMDDFNKLGRTDLICILAANVITDLPPPLLSRLSGMMFKFHGPTTPEEKADALASYFPSYLDKLPRNAMEKAKWLVTKYPKYNGRDFKYIYQTASDGAEAAGDVEITMDHIEQAMEKIHQERIDSHYYQEDETPQEQAERHFNWNRNFTILGQGLSYLLTGLKLVKIISKFTQGDVGGAVDDGDVIDLRHQFDNLFPRS